ncbi:hypothetical protein GCM10009745_48870 [Kribbella yunnanensis]|uniref:Uncharacterized protein n=1 Tax=Kribbella yunnanensis TaxID=190194 RepID=A0ABP4U0G7_9ACTN
MHEYNEARYGAKVSAGRRHPAGSGGRRRGGLSGRRPPEQGQHRRRIRHGCQGECPDRLQRSERDGRHHRTDEYAAAGHNPADTAPYCEGRHQNARNDAQPAGGFHHPDSQPANGFHTPAYDVRRGIPGGTDQARRPVSRRRDRLRGS